jgi:hypothetical protein
MPYYLRRVSRYHEFCSRENVDGSGKDAIASYLQDLAKGWVGCRVTRWG